ncbi:thioredoxin binding protein tBP-2 VDUP1, putative [Bodo saltans]|uniref:Thioredoxin binding protein tBP-2 VDUP1, putative n=1 Tax=Bodo saltans TaxID=75058 RepID=A0A0S4JHW7_BODSA|nr:thioredoxin binding protein tBP-2 VDUP1, putative [Bodo saltans]|eukprot:CUG91089.1 thioredoxin binding protein tBP-2 VDUP1, putative [Bodo saltans]
MPFFEKDKFQCEILLQEVNGSEAVYLGESVMGSVKVHAHEAANVRGIVLSYTVKEHFASIPMFRANGDTEPKKMVQGSRIRHKIQCLLLGSRNHPAIDVKAGEYSYPFVIPIPNTVPPSCPATILGAGNTCCNCCQCNCGPSHANIVSVEHVLSLEIIIPFSLLDKNDIFKEMRVLKPIHPSALMYSPMRSGIQKSNVFNCGGFLPQFCLRMCNCLLSAPDVPASYQLDVTNPLIVLTCPQPIGFTVRGTMRCRFVAQLVRRCRIQFPNSTYPYVTKSVLSHCECPPIGGASGISSGTLPTSHIANQAGITCPVSIYGAAVEVTYYVEIKPYFYTEPDGCCVDYLDVMKVTVPVEVVHCTLERAPIPSYLAQSTPASVAGRPGTSGGATTFVSNQMGQHYTPSGVEMGVVFSYEPPSGMESDFAPAGPILEPLGPPVWGTLVI